MSTQNGNNFKLKFDGQQNQIDANILINSLIHTTNIVHEINRVLQPDVKLEIKVRAPEKGSFLIDLHLIADHASIIASLFGAANINYTANIIRILSDLFNLKKHLHGEKAKEVKQENSSTIITNNAGQTMVLQNPVFNIYGNANVQDALAHNFDSIGQDPSISGFEITDSKDEALVRIDRDEFPEMSRRSVEVKDDERIITEAATLHILRCSFESNLKWDFVYKGNKISARINDPKFYELVDKGESFAKGDMLNVELQIFQKWEPSANTYLNKSYQVNNMLRHLKRGEQARFEFTE